MNDWLHIASVLVTDEDRRKAAEERALHGDGAEDLGSIAYNRICGTLLADMVDHYSVYWCAGRQWLACYVHRQDFTPEHFAWCERFHQESRRMAS